MTVPLAAAGINVVAISTFDTDYLVVTRDCRAPTVNVWLSMSAAALYRTAERTSS